MSLNTYLFFDGNCREAFDFYKDCLKAEIVFSLTFGDTPDGGPASEEGAGDISQKIAHICLEKDGFQLMASDEPGTYERPQGFRVCFNGKTPEEAKEVFDALSKGAEVTMPIGGTFFSPAFGMLRDKFGIPWIVNTQTPE
jgi:PhnB protein